MQSTATSRSTTFDTAAGGQKDQWYQHVYSTDSNGGTPLREALSRVGRYYANVTTGINNGMDASPIQYSCQPNYAILMTDGYWNGSNNGKDLSGNSVGNQDNVDAGYSTRADRRLRRRPVRLEQHAGRRGDVLLQDRPAHRPGQQRADARRRTRLRSST